MPPSPARSGGGAFPTTQWSLVVFAGAGSGSQAHAAFESLCRQYWYPLYTFIRRQGRTHHEAEDCTQEFLARLLASDWVARARPERGRFRTFLLTSLRNFLTDEWQRGQAAKRGGDRAHLPLEFGTAGERFVREPADPGLTPEQAFDRSWAQDTIGHAIDGLRDEYGKNGRGALFAALEPLVWDSSNSPSHAALAERLGMNANSFTVGLRRLRQRLGERLREEVAQIVADDAEVDAELRYLITALGGPVSPG
jgi:RNA polymerase sigma-70 factor (ECF subfamily)